MFEHPELMTLAKQKFDTGFSSFFSEVEGAKRVLGHVESPQQSCECVQAVQFLEYCVLCPNASFLREGPA